jgi:glycosyltransferase involved in cell wall biosynthesis
VGAWPGRLVPDRSLRVLDGGRVLIGGSPLTVLRFGGPIDLDDLRSPEVIGRLVDRGMVHPAPATGPWGPRDVTVVIPTFDEPAAVARSLDALAREAASTSKSGGFGGPGPHNPPDFGVAEVIVVDDGSTRAATHEAVVDRDWGDLSVRMVVRARNGGPAAARNSGLAEVGTPLVAFLDAGCTPVAPGPRARRRGSSTPGGPAPEAPIDDPDGWLAPLLAHFADPRVALVAPRIVAGPLDESVSWPAEGRRPRRWVAVRLARYEQRRSPLDLGDEAARVAPRTRVAYVPTACVLARVDALRAIGGFDESLRVGEDVDLVWRLGEATPSWRVRFEPAAEVVHDTRTRLSAWWSRRVDYGTSAAPLDRRHPGAVAPVSVSPWSAAAWGLLALGHPFAAVGSAAMSTALLARSLERLPEPWRQALRLAGIGNLAAGRLLADAVRRAWWPGAGVVLVVGPRPLRRAAVAAFVLPPLVEWCATRPELDPISFAALRTADDLAYGVGVWLGCLRERSFGPLVPDWQHARRGPDRSGSQLSSAKLGSVKGPLVPMVGRAIRRILPAAGRFTR